MNVTFLDFLPASCEIAVFLGIVLMLIVALLKLDRCTSLLDFIAPSVFGCAFIVLLLLPHSNVHAFSGTFVGDYFSYVGKFVILFLMFFISILSSNVRKYENLKSFEFVLLLSFALLGMLFMISTIDFIVAFIGLEIVSLSLYVLVSMNRTSPKASEAGIKIFIYGSIATAFFLFGISLLYGITGSTHFDNIATDLHTAIVQKKDITIAVIGVVFILISFAIKLALAPVHFWLADIFQGASYSAILFLATAPKFAEVLLLMRILMQALPDLMPYWKPVILMFTILTLIMGTLGALRQNNIRRFLAYSGTANMGFVMLALAQGTEVGCAAAGFYMFIYAVTMFSILGILMILETKGIIVDTFQDLNLVVTHFPFLAFCLGVLIVSIAGLPFAPGFFTKIYVLYSAMFQEAYTLSILAILVSLISTGYYLKFLKAISMLSPHKIIKKNTSHSSVSLKISVGFVFLTIIGSLFLLNFFVYLSHKTAVDLMH